MLLNTLTGEFFKFKCRFFAFLLCGFICRVAERRSNVVVRVYLPPPCLLFDGLSVLLASILKISTWFGFSFGFKKICLQNVHGFCECLAQAMTSQNVCFANGKTENGEKGILTLSRFGLPVASKKSGLFFLLL